MVRHTIETWPFFVVVLCLPALAQVIPSLQSGPLEATSRLGRKLYGLPDGDGGIQAAKKNLAADPSNADLVVKLSKAQSAKRQYREAVATCTAGLAAAPANAELYLERGHRELGLREFETARRDLSNAVQLNPRLLDAHYHLGMAYYFLRDFTRAAQSFARALELAQNSDSVIDCSNWLYVSRSRAGQRPAAAQVLTRITPDIKNTEPHLLFYLRLLHFYQGALPESEMLPAQPANAADIEGELSYNTINYGIGNWHLYHEEDPKGARRFFELVVKGSAWNSWGFIGSELELAK